MPNNGIALAFAAAISGLFAVGYVAPAQGQSAADAANELALMLDSAASELNGDNLLSALEGAAETGQPMALWQLGLMYESGVGVEKNEAKAFHYFSQIANDYADAPPRSMDSDIVAQSFLKVGEYFRQGIPDAGIAADSDRSYRALYHAAVYFGDADAQYRLFLTEQERGYLPAQSARWLSLAARKGHPAAQARLGELLVTGNGIEPQPVEGLMWLSLAKSNALGSADELWIAQLNEQARSYASETQIEAARMAADTLGSQFGGY